MTAIPAEIDVRGIRILMMCEAPPDTGGDLLHLDGDSMFVRNTLMAFESAGVELKSITELPDRGVYLTAAVKVPNPGGIIPASVIKEHSFALEEEISALPNLKAILLMGDTAIKALNYISRRRYGKRATPAGSTYKIRDGEYYYSGIRVFPSYLQTGKNFLIEKSKRRMVAEDIENSIRASNDKGR